MTATADAATTDAHPWLKKYPADVKWDTRFEPKPLWRILDDAVATYPDTMFVDFLGKTFSYAEIGAMVSRAAKGFNAIGVGKGVKVGLFLPNCPQFVIAYYGVLKAGGTVVNYSPLYSEPELEHQIEDSHTDVMVTLNLNALYPKMERLLPRTRLKKLIIGTMPEVLPFLKSLLFPLAKRKDVARVPDDERHIWFKDLLDNDGAYTPVAVDPLEDIAVLQYTGGTTGVSKGAMLTHANLAANAEQSRLMFSTCDEGKETFLGVLPLFHVFAMTSVMNMAIKMGAGIIMHPRFELGAVMKDITKKKPTVMQGVPTMFLAMANHPKIQDYDLSSLKGCISGGAPLPVEVKQKFETLSGCTVVEGYGLTESSPVVSCNPMEGENKPGSIGLPAPATEIVVVDREDPHKVLPLGEDGEICVIGPQVMKGYWNRPEATADTIVDGRLRTGDVGYMDRDGYTFIIDRMKDLILAGGFNVYPRTVEEAIYQHPAVEEVTVIGVPDAYRGEAPKAFVKLRPNEDLTEQGLIEFLRDRLGKHELPRQVEFRAELPKTMIGKLSKKELVAEETAKHAARHEGKGAE
jgi:long-chain acyl-CoA synthetase